MQKNDDYDEEFKKEIENHWRLKHPNIVRLLGYGYEIKGEFVEYQGSYVVADKIYRALCFEFLHNGSLQRHLDGKMMVLHIMYWQYCFALHFVHLPLYLFL